jgi:HK97 family phage portal protein
MNLTALNRTPIGAAARGVGRVSFGAISGVAGTLSGIIFRSRAAWMIVTNRSRFDYRTEVGDPANNSIVGAVVGWIARNFPEAPVRIVHEGTTDIAFGPAATGPGAMLRLLERPNQFYSGVLQWMATVVDRIINGNAYWLKVRNRSGRVVELWWLPAFMVEPRWDERDSTSFISYYEYTVDSVKWAFRPQDIVHFRNGLDPTNPRKGRSKLYSLLREIFTDNEASNFTASLMRNLGVPGVVLAPANTGLATGKIDAEAVKTTFMEKFSGDKRGEPMVMTSPTDIKVLSWSPEQMNLTALRRIPEERVSGVLGVPAMVAQLGAGLERSSFTNYSEANVAAYTQGVIPDQRLMAAELEVQLLPEFADLERQALDVWFDWTKVSAMQFAFAQLWKSQESAATRGLTKRSDFKRAVGLPVAADGSDNVYIMPNNFVAVPAGGDQPPGGIRPALPGGNGAAIVESVPLLGMSSEVRCTGCNRLLAKRDPATPPGAVEIKCSKCGEMAAA